MFLALAGGFFATEPGKPSFSCSLILRYIYIFLIQVLHPIYNLLISSQSFSCLFILLSISLKVHNLNPNDMLYFVYNALEICA